MLQYSPAGCLHLSAAWRGLYPRLCCALSSALSTWPTLRSEQRRIKSSLHSFFLSFIRVNCFFFLFTVYINKTTHVRKDTFKSGLCSLSYVKLSYLSLSQLLPDCQDRPHWCVDPRNVVYLHVKPNASHWGNALW